MDNRLKLFLRAMAIVVKLAVVYTVMVPGEYFVYQGF